MKVAQIHNRYRSYGGEDAAVENSTKLLNDHGVQTVSLIRESNDISEGIAAKVMLGIRSSYSRSAYADMVQFLEHEKPDIAHVHNLYPLLTPSILRACREASVPVVMTVHNYRLVCPIGVHFTAGSICERCVGGREYSCILKNCRDNLPESTIYAVRTALARKYGLFANNVNRFISPSAFLKRRLVEAGYDERKFVVLPNFVADPVSLAIPAAGSYCGFVGRFSAEKGVETLAAAAALLPDIPFQLAGSSTEMPAVSRIISRNTRLVGPLSRVETGYFYRGARFIVIPSVSFEVCPLVALEAMSYGLPVVASRIGGLPEIIDDGVTGLLFQPGNETELSEKIDYMWQHPDICQKMGEAARDRFLQHYSDTAHFKRLVELYNDELNVNAPHQVLS